MLTLLLGATGYIGQAFTRELRRRGSCFIPLTRSAVDYTCFEQLFDYVRKMKPEFVINAAGSRGQAQRGRAANASARKHCGATRFCRKRSREFV